MLSFILILLAATTHGTTTRNYAYLDVYYFGDENIGLKFDYKLFLIDDELVLNNNDVPVQGVVDCDKQGRIMHLKVEDRWARRIVGWMDYKIQMIKDNLKPNYQCEFDHDALPNGEGTWPKGKIVTRGDKDVKVAIQCRKTNLKLTVEHQCNFKEYETGQINIQRTFNNQWFGFYVKNPSGKVSANKKEYTFENILQGEDILIDFLKTESCSCSPVERFEILKDEKITLQCRELYPSGPPDRDDPRPNNLKKEKEILIISLSVGIPVLILIIAVSIYFCCCSRKNKRTEQNNQNYANQNTTYEI